MLFETLWVWAVDGAGTAAHVYEVKALPEPYTHVWIKKTRDNSRLARIARPA